MARAQQVISDFSTGQISPLSEGRVRVEQYNSACRRLENFTVNSVGGVKRRAGAHFLAQTKNGGAARLIPFVFNRDQSYVIELGDKYARFYRDNSILLEGDTRISPDKYGDILSKTHLGDVSATATGDVYEIVTPWSLDDIWDIHFAQANDLLIMVHPAYPVQTLSRYGASDWRIAATTFTDGPWTAETGYPRTVAFYQQRLWFGGSPTQPQTLWASRVADFFVFTVNADPDEIAPDDSLELTLASYTQESIQWLDSKQILLIGTSGSEQRLTPDQYLSVNNLPNIARTSTYGSRNIMPVHIGELTVFVQGSGRQIRSYSQNVRSAVEQYISRDLAWFAEDITESGVIAQSYELVPDSILWQVRADGKLISMTHDPSIDAGDFTALGWAIHPTQGEVVSVITIPHDYRDETWICTKRNGTYCVEFLDFSVYTDSALTVPPDNEVELAGVGGLDHLEGMEVQVIVDGGIQSNKTVSGGQILFDSPGTQAEVGLAYVSTLETTKFNDANSAGTNLGTSQRWAQVYVKLVDSALPLVNGQRPAARSPSTPMGDAEELRTGDYDIQGLGWDLDGTITVIQDLPKKTQLIALYGVYQSNAG